MSTTTQPSPAITAVLRWPSAYPQNATNQANGNTPSDFTTYFPEPIAAPPCTLTCAGTLTLSGDIHIAEGKNKLQIRWAPYWNDSMIFNMPATYNYFPEMFPNQIASFEPVTDDGLGDPYGYMSQTNTGMNCFTVLPNRNGLSPAPNVLPAGTKLSFPLLGDNSNPVLPDFNTAAGKLNSTSVTYGNWSNNLPSSEWLNWHNVYLSNIVVTVPYQYGNSVAPTIVSVNSTTVLHWANTQCTPIASDWLPASTYGATGSIVVLPFNIPWNAGVLDSWAKNQFGPAPPQPRPLWTSVSTSALVHGIRSAPSAINVMQNIAPSGTGQKAWFFNAPGGGMTAGQRYAPAASWFFGAPMFSSPTTYTSTSTPSYESATKRSFDASCVPNRDPDNDYFCCLGGAMACGQLNNAGQLISDTYQGYGYRFSTPYGRSIATFRPMFAWIDVNQQLDPEKRYTEPIFTGNYTKLYTVTTEITITPGTYSSAGLAQEISNQLTASSTRFVKSSTSTIQSQTRLESSALGVFDPVFHEEGAVVFSAASFVDSDRNVFSNGYQAVHISAGPQRPLRMGAPSFGLQVNAAGSFAFTNGAAPWATPEAQPGSALIGNTSMVCYTTDFQQRMPWDPAARVGDGSGYPLATGWMIDGYCLYPSIGSGGPNPTTPVMTNTAGHYLWFKSSLLAGDTNYANNPIDLKAFDFRGLIDQSNTIQHGGSYAINPYWITRDLPIDWFIDQDQLYQIGMDNGFTSTNVIQWNSQPQLIRFNVLRGSNVHGPYGLLLLGLGDGSATQNQLLTAMGFNPVAVASVYEPRVNYIQLEQPGYDDPTRLENNWQDYWAAINHTDMFIDPNGIKQATGVPFETWVQNGNLGPEVQAYVTENGSLQPLLGSFFPTVHPTSWNLTAWSRVGNCGYQFGYGNLDNWVMNNIITDDRPNQGFNDYAIWPVGPSAQGVPNQTRASAAFEAAMSDIGFFGMPGLSWLTQPLSSYTSPTDQLRATVVRYKCAKKPVRTIGALQLHVNEPAFCAYQFTINEQTTPSAIWNNATFLATTIQGNEVDNNGHQFEWVVLSENEMDQSECIAVPNPSSSGIVGNTVPANYSLNSLRLRLTFNGGTQITSSFYDEGHLQSDFWPVLASTNGTNTQTVTISCNVVWYTPGLLISRIRCELASGPNDMAAGLAQSSITLTMNPTGELPPVDQAFFDGEGMDMQGNAGGLAQTYTSQAPTPAMPNASAAAGGTRPVESMARVQKTMDTFRLAMSNSSNSFLNTRPQLRGRLAAPATQVDEVAVKRARKDQPK